MNPTLEIQILDPRLQRWGLPRYQSAQAAAVDLMACIDAPIVIRPQAAAVLIPTGIALHMNDAHLCALIVPRSGLGHKRGLVLGNGLGLIDADYTAQCFVSAWNRNPAPGAGAGGDEDDEDDEDDGIVIEPGDRIAQLLFLPVVRPRFEVVDSFSQRSERGGAGFGSTGVSA